MGWKKAIDILESIITEGLNEKNSEKAEEEIKEFYQRKGNIAMITNSFR
jgi:hypothetical protein